MKSYYYLEHVSESNYRYSVQIIGTYTNLRLAIRDANAFLRGMNYNLMGKNYYRISTEDGLEIRRYGYMYDNTAYKWKLNNRIVPGEHYEK